MGTGSESPVLVEERKMAYSDKVIDHYENPRNVGSFDKKDQNVGSGIVNTSLLEE